MLYIKICTELRFAFYPNFNSRMPTIICLDVSLSMKRQYADVSLLEHAVSACTTFLKNLHNIVPNEYIQIITFSSTATVLVRIGRNMLHFV